MKTVLRFVCATMMVCVVSSLGEAKTVTLTARADCQVDNFYPDTPFPNLTDMASFQEPAEPGGEDHFSYFFFQFQLPDDCQPDSISEVTFTMTRTAAGSVTPAGYFVVLSSDSFEAAGVDTFTWNNAPAIGRSPEFNNGAGTHYVYPDGMICGYKQYSVDVPGEMSYTLPNTVAYYWDMLHNALAADNNGILTFFWFQRYYGAPTDHWASIEHPACSGPRMTITYPSTGEGLGITLAETESDTIVYEASATGDSYTLVLDEVPADDVQVSVTTDPCLIIQPDYLTFTQSNWHQPQTVQITPINDDKDQLPDTRTLLISHVVTSTDSFYDGYVLADLQAIIYDDEGPCDPGAYRNEDIIPDCRIDLYDFLSLASAWLTCTDPARPDICD